jgi:hypothetical protein
MSASGKLALATLFLILLAALAFFAPTVNWVHARQVAFLLAVVLMILEFVAIGLCISNHPAGVIIDSRNVMSLSKLQACAWTILVLSALLIAAAFNLSTPDSRALDIVIPPDLLVAMGISATSLAATPALLSLKTNQPSPVSGGAPVNVLATNASISDADWTDMLTGDETGNQANPDLGKIQQFLVTLLLLGVYGLFIVRHFTGARPIHSLPPLDPSFIWLLGISHASYLAYKAAPHTVGAPAPTAAPPPAP